MYIDELMLFGYRGISAIVALVMAAMVLRSSDWRVQVYAALVFVPFVLRALGVK
jgi:ABC-type uncharacterized transport system permease subunit